MANNLIRGPARDSETDEERPAPWTRFVAGFVKHWPIPWPIANGILLIMLIGWLIPLVPDGLSALGQGIGKGWAWLRATPASTETSSTNAETIRNMFLTLGGGLALFLAWRRTFDAYRQTEEQITQSKTAIRGQQSERFQAAIQHLAGGNRASRVAATQELILLRKESFDTFDVPVRRIFAEYISETNHTLEDQEDDFGVVALGLIWSFIQSSFYRSVKFHYDDLVVIRNAKFPYTRIRTNRIADYNFLNVDFNEIEIGDRIGSVIFAKCKIDTVLVNFESYDMLKYMESPIFVDCKIKDVNIFAKFYDNGERVKEIFDGCEVFRYNFVTIDEA